MKRFCTALVLLVAVLLAGCAAPMKPNPDTADWDGNLSWDQADHRRGENRRAGSLLESA